MRLPAANRAITHIFLLLTILGILLIGRSEAKPPPLGFGVAVGYELGGERELDLLGTGWYFDYDFRGEALGNRRRLFTASSHANLKSVAEVARRWRGEWWQFGNEPNDPNQDDISPAEYASRYHVFYNALKAEDGSARVLPAGIADADWKWADAFRESYHSQFGRYPSVDGWNIHNYLLETCEGALDVAAFQARILAFRHWMTRVGEGSKPLFLTEYGVLYGNGRCGCPLIRSSQVVTYMQTTTQWLIETGLVQGWAWFALSSSGRYNGDLFTADMTLTEVGGAYRDMIHATGNRSGR